MGRVRQMGDEKAFDELYRRYARRLYGFFFRMLGREGQLASDFTQELLLRVWAVRGRYECGRELCPWFFTMAYNLCRNEYRFRNIAVGFAEEVVLLCSTKHEAFCRFVSAVAALYKPTA